MPEWWENSEIVKPAPTPAKPIGVMDFNMPNSQTIKKAESWLDTAPGFTGATIGHPPSKSKPVVLPEGDPWSQPQGDRVARVTERGGAIGQLPRATAIRPGFNTKVQGPQPVGSMPPLEETVGGRAVEDAMSAFDPKFPGGQGGRFRGGSGATGNIPSAKLYIPENWRGWKEEYQQAKGKVLDTNVLDIISHLPGSALVGLNDIRRKIYETAKDKLARGDYGPTSEYQMTPMGGYMHVRYPSNRDGLVKTVKDYEKREMIGEGVISSVMSGIADLPSYMGEMAAGGIGQVSGVGGAAKFSAKMLGIQFGRIEDAIGRQMDKGERGYMSFAKGIGDVYIENLSETAGAGFPVIARKLPFAGKIFGSMEKYFKSTGMSTNEFWKRMGSQVGYNGLLGEWGEERLATVMKGMVNVDDFGAGPQANADQRIIAGLAQDMTLSNQLVEIGVLATPMVAQKLGTATYRGKVQMDVEEGPDEFYLKSIQAKPTGTGAGTSALLDLMQKSEETGKPIRLQVGRVTDQAKRAKALYDRLGFQEVESANPKFKGVEMTYTPSTASTTGQETVESQQAINRQAGVKTMTLDQMRQQVALMRQLLGEKKKQPQSPETVAEIEELEASITELEKLMPAVSTTNIGMGYRRKWTGEQKNRFNKELTPDQQREVIEKIQVRIPQEDIGIYPAESHQNIANEIMDKVAPKETVPTEIPPQPPITQVVTPEKLETETPVEPRTTPPAGESEQTGGVLQAPVEPEAEIKPQIPDRAKSILSAIVNRTEEFVRSNIPKEVLQDARILLNDPTLAQEMIDKYAGDINKAASSLKQAAKTILAKTKKKPAIAQAQAEPETGKPTDFEAENAMLAEKRAAEEVKPVAADLAKQGVSEEEKISGPIALKGEAWYENRWDTDKLGTRVSLVMKAKWVTGKKGNERLTKLGEKISQNKWKDLTPAARNVLRPQIDNWYGRKGKQEAPAAKGEAKVEGKPPEASIGAAAANFTSQNPALQRAIKLAKETGKDHYVVQSEKGKFSVKTKAPAKGNYTVVNPKGDMHLIKQASTVAEDSFDYGEAVRRQEKFDNKLDEFKAKLKEKNADVKAIQDELFNMVKASGMTPASVKNVLGLLRNIRPQQQQQTNLKTLMKAIARASEYTGQQNRRILRQQIMMLLKKVRPKKIHGRYTGKLTPEVQRRLDYIHKNILRRRDNVLKEMAANIQKVQEGTMDPIEMLERNNLLNIVGLRGMSFAEMANAYKNIKMLFDQGKMVHDAKIEAMKELKAQRKARFMDILTGGKGLKEGYTSLPDRDVEKRPGWINKLNRASNAWDNIMDYLSRFDKTSGPYQSDLSKFGDKVHLSEHNEAKGIETYSKEIHDGFADVFGTESPSEMWKIIHGLAQKNINLGTFTDRLGRKITWNKLSKLELMKRYMELQDPTLTETFDGKETDDGKQYGMFWAEDMKLAIVDALDAKDKAWTDWVMDFYRRYYPSINDVYKSQYYIALPHNNFYSPINRMVEGDYGEETLLFKEVIRHASTTNPSLMARVKNMNPLRWTDTNSVLMNHVVRMEHFKHWAETMHDLRSIFSDKDIRNAIRQYHGPHILRRIDTELDEFARGGINQMLVNNWVDRLRRNFTSAALARPAIAPKQIPSILSFLTEMPLKDFISGVTKFWLSPIRNADLLMEKSPIFKESVKGGYERDVRLVMHKGTNANIAGRRSFREWMFAHIRLGDYIARGPGQYAKWLSEKKKGLNDDSAMREAEKTTGRTQPGWKLSQLSAPQKGGSVWKLFTMFQTQPIRYYNMAIDNARNAAYGRGSRLKALANLALIWVVLPMLFNWIADAFQWKKKHQMVAVALGPFGYIPIAGKLITNIALAVVGEAYDTQLSPIQSIPERFKRAASAARRLFKNQTDSTKDTTVEDAVKVTEELAEGIGYVTGLPTPYIVQTERAVRDIAHGKIPDEERKQRLPGWRQSPFSELIFSPYALKAEESFAGYTLEELEKKKRDWTYDKTGYSKRQGKKVHHKRGDPISGKTKADIDRLERLIDNKKKELTP